MSEQPEVTENPIDLELEQDFRDAVTLLLARGYCFSKIVYILFQERDRYYEVEEEMNQEALRRHEEMSTKHAFPVWAKFQSLGWRVVGYVERSQIPSSDEEEEELHSLAWDLIEQSERYQGYRVIDWTV